MHRAQRRLEERYGTLVEIRDIMTSRAQRVSWVQIVHIRTLALNRWKTPAYSTRFCLKTPNFNFIMANTERTYIMIKPDGVKRGLVGQIVERFQRRGFKLVAMKMVQATKEILDQHYCDLVQKPYYPNIVEFMTSGPVVSMVWEGSNAVKIGRVMLGATYPLESAPGTIRGDFALDVGRNVCHGSDSVENAEKEIALWFKKVELFDYKLPLYECIYEN